MTHYFIIPGLGNSGPEHWQTFFETTSDNFQRINQKEWDAPVCDDWIETIDKTLSSYDLSEVILIGHSLGCATIAFWAKKYNRKIKGALLVAPSDPESPLYVFPSVGFSEIPKDKLSFRSIVVASTDDPWVSIDRAKYFASNWGSEFISIGNGGHINAASGHNQWHNGLEILKTLG